MSDLTLTDRLHDVAEARRKLRQRQDREFRAHEIVAEDPNYQAWQDMVAARRSQEGEVALAEQVAKSEALQAVIDGLEELPDGMQVKRFSVVTYDAKEVSAWARFHLPAVMVLDAKKFERAVKDGLAGEAPTVQIIIDARVQLAADLSAYLD
jgi:hypothetical protein